MNKNQSEINEQESPRTENVVNLESIKTDEQQIEAEKEALLKEVEKEVLKTFKIAFKGFKKLGVNDHGLLFEKAARCFQNSMDELHKCAGELVGPESLYNAIQDEKAAKIKKLAASQVKGMAYDQLLAMDIFSTVFTIKNYAYMAERSFREKNWDMVAISLNNLRNWGGENDYKSILEKIVNVEFTDEEKETMPKHLHDMVRAYRNMKADETKETIEPVTGPSIEPEDPESLNSANFEESAKDKQ